MVFSRIPFVVPEQLLPRGRLKRIIMEVFLKTVLPAHWHEASAMAIREPLNMNTFFKFLIKLADLR